MTRTCSILTVATIAAAGAFPSPAGATAGPPTPTDPTPAMSEGPTHGPILLHTYLEESEPEDGEVMEEEVERVLFQFNTPVQLQFSEVTVQGPQGEDVDHGDPERVDGLGEEHFQVRFPEPLEPGSYTVSWQTAGPDDHVVRDAFAFTVADPEVDEPPPPEAAEPVEAVPEWTDPTGEPVGVGARWIFLLAVVGMIGTVAFRTLIVPRLASDEGLGRFGELASFRTWVMGWITALVGLLTLPFLLWLQSSSFFGPDALRVGNLATVVFNTPWGAGFLVSLLGIVFFGAGLAAAGRGGTRPAGWAVCVVAALTLPLASALSGHAWGAAGEDRPLAVLSVYAHVLGAGVWMGSLGAVLLVGVPALRAVRKQRKKQGLTSGEEDAGALPGLGRLVSTFSTVALVAVAVLVASGVVQTLVLAGPPWTLAGSEYGRTLLVKLGIAAGALLLGFYNWRVVRPSLQQRPSMGLLRIPATLELLLGVGVLLVTAVLVAQALP